MGCLLLILIALVASAFQAGQPLVGIFIMVVAGGLAFLYLKSFD